MLDRRMTNLLATLKKRESSSDQDSQGLAETGTRFVAASHNHHLTRAVHAMVDSGPGDSTMNWLRHRRDASREQIKRLGTLANASKAVASELDRARQNTQAIDEEIEVARRHIAFHDAIASQLKTVCERTVDPVDESPNDGNLDSLLENQSDRAYPMIDASLIRHWLWIERKRQQAEASQIGVEATMRYLQERLARLKEIPSSARPPRELGTIREQIVESDLLRCVLSDQLAALGHEQVRLLHQWRVQRSEPFQLVQAASGALIDRHSMQSAMASLAVTTAVGDLDHSLLPPVMLAYVESQAVHEAITSSICNGRAVTGLAGATSRCKVFAKPLVLRSWRLAGGNRDKIAWLDPFKFRFDADFRPHTSPTFTPPYDRDRDRDRRRDPRNFARFNPYGSFPFGRQGQSILSYRFAVPTRASFPYRSSYRYRTAFPSSDRDRPGDGSTWRSFQWQGQAVRSAGLEPD